MLGISRGELDIGRDMLGIDRDMLGIGRDMLGSRQRYARKSAETNSASVETCSAIGRDMLGSRTCRNNNPHRGRQYLHLWG